MVKYNGGFLADNVGYLMKCYEDSETLKWSKGNWIKQGLCYPCVIKLCLIMLASENYCWDHCGFPARGLTAATSTEARTLPSISQRMTVVPIAGWWPLTERQAAWLCSLGSFTSTLRCSCDTEHTFPLSDWPGSTFPLLTKICEKLCREVSLLLCPLTCIVFSSPSSHQNNHFY